MVVAIVDGKWWGRRERKICMLSPGGGSGARPGGGGGAMPGGSGMVVAIVNSLLGGRIERKICTLLPGVSGIRAWRWGGDI